MATSDGIDRLTTALADRYRVERELGRGGMATVYLAHDVKHNRTVAVKMFRPEFAQSVGADRFLREIQIAAQLTHPHIVSLIDSGEAAGLLYYLMPFVDGETLRARMRRDGALPVDAALHIAREVADALAYAHRRGVIHRDIKPENILLADGHAFVTDFGIARAVEPAAQSLTQTGFALGTPAYMAPEQAVGEKDVDGRADIYALGCVLHEMLTGSPPYAGKTQQAMLVKRFTEPVPLLRAKRPDAPEWLEGLLQETLATDPCARPADATVFRSALVETHATPRTQMGYAAADAAQSIAVLPFANMSADPDNEYFSDGISEELINALTQFPNLKVIARTSAFSFKGKNVDVREIGRALGVRHILEGSVRRAGSALRVTAQLIDAADGSHKWSTRYDRAVADVFAIQDEITAAIADAVGGTLFGSRPAAKYQTDEATYDLFLRGRALLFQSSARFAEAYDLITRATERDPDFIPALVALGDAHSLRVWFALTPGREGWARVRALAGDIAARDPGSAAAKRLLAAAVSGAERNFVGAESLLREAVAANPSDVMAHGILSLVLIALGRVQEADVHTRRVIALDPLSPMSHAIAANNWAVAGQLAEAEAAASAAIELDPRYPEGYHMRGYTRNYLGRFQEAENDLARVPGLGNRTGWPLAKRSIALAGLGRCDEVRRILDGMLAQRAVGFVTPDAIACIHAILGQNDEAFRWLSQAVEEQAGWVGYIGVDPLFAPLRRDPRFEPFCREHGIPCRPLPPTALDHLEPPPAQTPSVVVLPFDNLSPDPNDAYLADGLTEELISDLSRIRKLKVISRNSAIAVKLRTRNVREIARLVDVRYVLEGSIRHAGNNLRITAQLIDGATDAHVWTEKYSGTMDDVFAMQERVSREIVEALQLTLAPTESRRITVRPIPNLVAYECYLRARNEVHGYTREHLARADALLERAEAAAGENALLLACKAWVHMQRYNLAPGPDRTEVRAATALAERARSLDPHCSLAVLVLALLQPFDGRVIDSLLYLRQALTLDPSNVDALTWIGYVYAALGRDDDARRPIQRALELDPLSHFPAVAAAWVDYQAGRFEEASARLAPWVAGPEGVLHAACIQCIFALAPLGRLDDMEALATRYNASVPDEPLYQYVRFLYFGLRRDRAGALAALTPALEEWQRSGHAEYTLHLAQGFAVIGETDRALACVERTVDLQYLNHDFLARHDPLLASLRPDPRFQALLARVKREQAEVANL